MNKKILRPFILITLLAIVASAGDFKPPKLTPTPTSDKNKALADEGIALHDKGDYDGAIKKYEQVLADSPGDLLAQYELAYSLLARKDYQRSLDVAVHGAEYKSDRIGEFYVLIGTDLDLLGKPDEAIKAYKAGIKLAPADAFLYFNLAVTQLAQGKNDEARKNLKIAVAIEPDYASAHFVLARAFLDGGYKVPALLAASRFLTLEPRSARSQEAVAIVDEVLRGGVQQGAKPTEITINLDLNGKKDEGDFGTIDLTIGIARASNTIPENKGKSEAQLLVDEWDTILDIVSELDAGKNKSTFTYRYYLPYFVTLKRQGFVEPFVYYTMQQSAVPGVDTWLQANAARVKAFMDWSGQFPWPRNVGV